MKILSLLFCMMLITVPCFSYNYGYYTEDVTGNVIETICIVTGEAPVKVGATFTPCTEEEVKTIVVWEEPLTEDEQIAILVEDKIQAIAEEELILDGTLEFKNGKLKLKK